MFRLGFYILKRNSIRRMDFKDYFNQGWKSGLAIGVVLGILTIAVEELSFWFAKIPAWIVATFGLIGLPELGRLEFYIPVIIYAALGATMGWLYDHRKRMWNIQLYKENKFAGVALFMLFILPAILVVGNASGLWAAFGVGGVIVYVENPDGTPVGDGLAYVTITGGTEPVKYHGSGYRTSRGEGKVYLPNLGDVYDIPLGEVYAFTARCVSNPDDVYAEIYGVPEAIFPDQFQTMGTISFTTSCGGTVNCDPPTDHWDCYMGDIWYYNACNVRTTEKQSCANGCQSDPPICIGDIPEECVNECTSNQLETCVGTQKCVEQWDNTVGDYCRVLIPWAGCNPTTTTSTIGTSTSTLPGDQCTNNQLGSCIGTSLCEYSASQSRNVLTPMAPQCVCVNDCTGSGCISGTSYRCGQYDIDNCLDRLYDSACAVTTTSVECISDCTTPGTCSADYICNQIQPGCYQLAWDEDCSNHITTTSIPTTTTTTPIVIDVCGDDVCSANESKLSCPRDCADGIVQWLEDNLVLVIVGMSGMGLIAQLIRKGG